MTRKPDLLWLYRGGSHQYRWIRRTTAGAIVNRSPQGFATKAAMWRNTRRLNRDYETCRIDDRTFTWHRGTGPNLSRPPGARTPRELPTIREAQRRL